MMITTVPFHMLAVFLSSIATDIVCVACYDSLGLEKHSGGMHPTISGVMAHMWRSIMLVLLCIYAFLKRCLYKNGK